MSYIFPTNLRGDVLFYSTYKIIWKDLLKLTCMLSKDLVEPRLRLWWTTRTIYTG